MGGKVASDMRKGALAALQRTSRMTKAVVGAGCSCLLQADIKPCPRRATSGGTCLVQHGLLQRPLRRGWWWRVRAIQQRIGRRQQRRRSGSGPAGSGGGGSGGK